MKVATIVMAHADTEFRKKLLKECLLSINTPIILSTNFQVSVDVQLLCDYVIYTKNNHILKKEEYAEFNVSYNYWIINELGEKIYELMEYEHGFAAYCLIRDGIEYAKIKGFDTVHCINYDYTINEVTITNHEQYLESYNLVVYRYDKFINYDDFGKGKYSTGFFSGKIETLLSFFTKFNTKKDYYLIDGFSILERKMYNHYSSILIKELEYNFLEKTNKTNQEGVLMFSKSKEELLSLNKNESLIKPYKPMSKLKILFLAPHLSTGGMPAFLLKRIHALSNTSVEIIVVEYANLSDEYVVHKKQIKELSDHFYTLHEDKVQLLEIIKKHEIDVVHIEEMAEDSVTNFSIEMLNFLYDNGRTWNIVETCHNVLFNPDVEKKYHPDAYVFCTSYHYTTFERMPSSKFLIEYPIEKTVQSNNIKKVSMEFLSLNPDKIHVLNVGLWTPGKNQKEGVEIAREFPDVEFHFVGNQAVNFKNYWEPIMTDLPNNVHVWGEKFHVDVFMSACDIFMFNSTWECNPLVLREAASYNMPILARNLSQYENMFNGYILPFDNDNKLEKMQELLDGWKPTRIPQSSAMFDFKVNHLYVYNEVIKGSKTVQEIDFNIHFVKQPFFEIKGPSKSDFLIKFIDNNDVVIYENTIKTNSWVKLNRRWFTNWKIKVWENNNFIFEYNLDFKDKRVFITIESSSLGDSIAWMPYLEEFRKKHECTLIVSTFKNFLFEKSYPDIEFVSPGSVVHNLQGMYSIGWFYDLEKEPTLPNVIPLQKTATNILGLEYQEIKPLISFEPLNVPIQEKYITIATNSTAGCKFWTKEGWQEVINYLFEKGYRVINVSLEDNPFENCTSLEDKSINNVMNYIYHSEFFIGLSSGLSWLAWALNKKVVMISNFSEANHEFDCFRVVKKTVCNGCWNNPKYKFDKSWNWCPEHAGTDRQFECQTSISGEDIISLLNQKLLT